MNIHLYVLCTISGKCNNSYSQGSGNIEEQRVKKFKSQNIRKSALKQSLLEMAASPNMALSTDKLPWKEENLIGSHL